MLTINLNVISFFLIFPDFITRLKNTRSWCRTQRGKWLICKTILTYYGETLNNHDSSQIEFNTIVLSFSQFACFFLYIYFFFGYTSGPATIPKESLILSDWETSHFDTNLFWYKLFWYKLMQWNFTCPLPPSEKKIYHFRYSLRMNKKKIWAEHLTVPSHRIFHSKNDFFLYSSWADLCPYKKQLICRSGNIILYYNHLKK